VCHLKCVTCGTSPISAQCSTTFSQVHSHNGLLCIQNGTEIILFSCKKNVGQQRGRLEIIETYIIGVWCEALNVGNYNGENM